MPVFGVLFDLVASVVAIVAVRARVLRFLAALRVDVPGQVLPGVVDFLAVGTGVPFRGQTIRVG